MKFLFPLCNIYQVEPRSPLERVEMKVFVPATSITCICSSRDSARKVVNCQMTLSLRDSKTGRYIDVCFLPLWKIRPMEKTLATEIAVILVLSVLS